MPARVDGKWDCCDADGQVHPGATTSYDWTGGGGSNPASACPNLVGDTNCDGVAQVDPASANSVVTDCDASGVTCQPVTRTLTSSDCGAGFSGCDCGDTCSRQCYVEIILSVSDPGQGCR